MRDTVKVLIAYAVGLLVMIVCIFLIIMVPTAISHLTRPKMSEVTTPLEAAVVRDLCYKLDLSRDGPLCQSEAIVYAPDFFPAVRALFKPGITTYDDIQEKLGNYQYKREPLITQADGTIYFMSSYDFRGDRVFPVVFSFTKEGTLEEIFATVGDD